MKSFSIDIMNFVVVIKHLLDMLDELRYSDEVRAFGMLLRFDIDDMSPSSVYNYLGNM